ncbi:MAG: c-type cytochrome [Halothiobacillus sp.]
MKSTPLLMSRLAGALALACAVCAPVLAQNAPVEPKSALNAALLTGATFSPPDIATIPKDEFGKVVQFGRNIMYDTKKYAPQYAGNSLNCVNCHTDGGAMAGSAPLWGAWVSYPAYRSKNKKVNTYEDRLQGCFRFSVNGKAPPLGSDVLVALEAYSYWLAKGLPVDEKVAGRGYPDIPEPAQAPDFVRGKTVYEANCAICHAANGEGRVVNGAVVFPPLWGAQSFNWGAGMGSIKNAAKFIYANMPYGQSYSLTLQQAWDVAYYMDGQERPQDPRWEGSVVATRAKYHNNKNSLYGTTVNGVLLGDTGAPKPFQPPKS